MRYVVRPLAVPFLLGGGGDGDAGALAPAAVLGVREVDAGLRRKNTTTAVLTAVLTAVMTAPYVSVLVPLRYAGGEGEDVRRGDDGPYALLGTNPVTIKTV